MFSYFIYVILKWCTYSIKTSVQNYHVKENDFWKKEKDFGKRENDFRKEENVSGKKEKNTWNAILTQLFKWNKLLISHLFTFAINLKKYNKIISN